MRRPMTTGEMAVWAAEFVRSCAAGASSSAAALEASLAVSALREVTSEHLSRDAREMLDDMLGIPSGLFCASGARAKFETSTSLCSLCMRPPAYHHTR